MGVRIIYQNTTADDWARLVEQAEQTLKGVQKEVRVSRLAFLMETSCKVFLSVMVAFYLRDVLVQRMILPTPSAGLVALLSGMVLLLSLSIFRLTDTSPRRRLEVTQHIIVFGNMFKEYTEEVQRFKSRVQTRFGARPIYDQTYVSLKDGQFLVKMGDVQYEVGAQSASLMRQEDEDILSFQGIDEGYIRLKHDLDELSG